MVTLLILVVVAFVAGLLGSMLGVGGGLILVPVMSLFLDVPLKTAIAASLVCVIVTSSASQVTYVGRGLTNTRLGMTLEIATTLGALAGGFTAVYLSGRILYGIFAAVLVYVVASMWRGRKEPGGKEEGAHSFVDPETGEVRRYDVGRWPFGFVASFVAGDVSALLGVGGGVVKVPIMNLVMGVPLRVSIATSNLMIGVTAATGAIVYYGHHLLSPRYAVPAALGVLMGAEIGPRIAGRVDVRALRVLFEIILVALAAQMAWKAVA